MEVDRQGRILVLEPFYGGSHKKLLDIILEALPKADYDLFTLTPKKWHWRARTSALSFSQVIPQDKYSFLLTSSVSILLMGLNIWPST